MHNILTRSEAANYLRISVRQLDRLQLPRYCIGSSPRFTIAELDEFLLASRSAPIRVKTIPQHNQSPAPPRHKNRRASAPSEITKDDIRALLEAA